ncbi:hypothetical protein KGP36_03455 [Patescibacteria group bacterium]|nr:hypothetical protein [Patescibacteria group bacterium]
MSSKPLTKKLRQQMAQSVAGSGPSLIPQAPPPRPKPEPEEEAPSIDLLIADTDDRDTLRSLIKSHVELNNQLSGLEKAIKPIKDRIKAIVGDYGIERAICDGTKISYSHSQRSTINGTKLLGAGIDPDIITRCTDVSDVYTLKVTPEKV